MAKAVVFTITYSLKTKFDLKQFQKTTTKTWKLVSPRPWIASYVARSGQGMLVITLIIYYHKYRLNRHGGGGGGAFDKKLQELLLHPILSLSTGGDHTFRRNLISFYFEQLS